MKAMTWLVAFVALFVTDVAWGFYVRCVGEKRALRAAAWAVILFLVGGVAVIGYTSDPWLLIPSAAGAFFGTVVAVRYSSRKAQHVTVEMIERANARLMARSNEQHGICKPGWYCSREKGHDGPCAAWPVSHDAMKQIR